MRPLPSSTCRKLSTESLSLTPREVAAISISKTRGVLYLIARLLGDVNAVKKGTVGRRLVRRAVGKATGRGLGKLFR